MGTSRNELPYMEGVLGFLSYAVSNFKKPSRTGQVRIEIPCPCKQCLNHISYPVSEVQHHLFRYGIDENYTIWTEHGEKDHEPPISYNYHVCPDNDDVDYEMHTTDNFTSEIPTDAAETVDMLYNAAREEENFDFANDRDYAKFRKLIEDAEKPLYKGCPDFTKLSAMVQLFNLKSKYGVSNKFFDDLLLLVKKMLPTEGNEMASDTYEVKRTFKALGSGYVKIHACENNCILYRGMYAEYDECPTCGRSRWKVKKVPEKVLWYFPIIPRLKRLYQSETTARNLRWHSESRITDGVLRHPADSTAWAAIDDKFDEIKSDPRNLRLGISADGVDVFRGNRHHSVWPILAVIYNLPPWLCMKRKFIMLSLLITGSPGNNIDVFLAPLIEDLQVLFEVGVETYDAYLKERFTLRAVVLWTINDYPALGALSGCPCSGFFGCVVCGKETDCVRLKRGRKQSYGGHRRYLPYDHPFRYQKKGFNGTRDLREAPIPKTGEEIYNEVKCIINRWGKDDKNNAKSDILQTSNPGRGGKIKRKRGTNKLGTSVDEGDKEKPYWKKFNIWHRKLRYWRFNSVNHCIDFMHIEKNVAESLIGTLLNIPGKTKDGLTARLDLDDMNLRPELKPKRDGNIIKLPAASYTLTTEEKDKFCDTLENLRVPQGYCSNFATLVSRKDKTLIGLKSHDYHMLMQQFLPLAIRSIMPSPTRYAIIR